MKVRIAHTHLNPRRRESRNAPLFIVVDGPKEECRECRKENNVSEPKKRS